MRCAASRSAGRARARFAFLALAAALFPAPPAAAANAVEYFHTIQGHYFVTASPQEIEDLDNDPRTGWRRTGERFGVLDAGAPSASNVCRFWSAQTYAPKSSHFYTPFASECESVKRRPEWRFEGEVFAMRLADPAGNCPTGTEPLYRLYNNVAGGAPNHRYTTRAAVRAQMIAQGWTPEGVGVGVIGCVPPATSPVEVVAAGDIGQCFGLDAAMSRAAQTAALVTPRDALVLTLGDHAYDYGTHEEFAGCFDPTWGAFRDRIRPAPGNHDYYTAGAAGYYDYFGARAGPDRRGYYSFDHAGWHFIALNSMDDVDAQSAQYRWLQDDLARSNALCTIAYFHHPAFNSGGVYGSVTRMRAFFDLLQSSGVEIVLSGHEHIYERFAPQRADGTPDPARGLRQFVVGTGGHVLNPLGAPIANSEFRQNTRWGVLRLSLEEAGYGWQFVPVGGGALLDSGTAACHR